MDANHLEHLNPYSTASKMRSKTKPKSPGRCCAKATKVMKMTKVKAAVKNLRRMMMK